MAVLPAGARRGVAYVLAVIALAIFAALAAALASQTGMGLRKASNQALIQATRHDAESGMAYFSLLLRGTRLSGELAGQELLEALASSLRGRLEGTANLGGQTVSYDGTQIVIPHISTDGRGAGFGGIVRLADSGSIRLTVTGREADCLKRVRMDFGFTPWRSPAFDYGIATRGSIELTGNPDIVSVGDRLHASLLAATFSELEAIALTGNACVGGDLFVSNPDAYVSLTGNVSVGGETQDGDIEEHIHIGIGEVEFPEPDPGVFEPFATNIVDGKTKTNGNRTFTNIRILANTNPNFSGNITLKGVVYIESPNRVTFSGNLDVIGVIVTEDARQRDPDDNSIQFTGNSSTRGVEYLPDTPEFAGLRELTGTFLLAPGFSVKFAGNFGTINGAMAAQEFRFTGNAGGTVRGPIIGWGDSEFVMTGNAHVTIDRQDSAGLLPGFVNTANFLPLPRTYEEM